MIVKELIEKLQELDQNTTVYYPEDDFHAMDFDFVTEVQYKEDIVVIIGDKPDPDNDGELVPFSHMNNWGVLS